MNILFLTIQNLKDLKNHDIYSDLLNKLISEGHHVYIVSPIEKKQSTKIFIGDSCTILKVKTGNIQKTNRIEKGISTLLIEAQFKSAIKKYFANI
ncbi:MAG: glycosyltransferase WbuB, partial [Eubacterium sp.]